MHLVQSASKEPEKRNFSEYFSTLAEKAQDLEV
jgi:hypothetical protein